MYHKICTNKCTWMQLVISFTFENMPQNECIKFPYFRNKQYYWSIRYLTVKISNLILYIYIYKFFKFLNLPSYIKYNTTYSLKYLSVCISLWYFFVFVYIKIYIFFLFMLNYNQYWYLTNVYKRFQSSIPGLAKYFCLCVGWWFYKIHL